MRDQNDSETLDSVYTYVSIQAELVKDADISRDDMLRAYKVWCRDIRRIEVFPVIGEEVILGRSLKNLIETVNTLKERGVEFVSLTEKIDTTTPGGKLIFHLMGALAEFERDLTRERTSAGLEAARARGRKGGRPKALKTAAKV